MKQILFSLFFFLVLAVGADAQKASCSKPCTTKSAASCQSKSPSVATTQSETDYTMAAAKMASLDPTIESRTCPVTGAVSYVRKETCGHSGTVSYVDVSYDASTNTFVNVAPSKMEGSKTSGKACCTSGAAAGKGCCAGKAATTTKTEKVKS